MGGEGDEPPPLPGKKTPTPLKKKKSSRLEKLERAKEQAAIKVQARLRGKAGRKAAEKHIEESRSTPCNNYRINMSAENFGDCVCGFPKLSHSKAAISRAAAKDSGGKKMDDEAIQKKMLQREKAPCKRYQVNLQSANFGECICGRAKADHTDAALRAGGEDAGLSGKMTDEEVQKKMLQREKAPCLRYQVNLNAANFGECICGRPKAEHTDAALKACKAVGDARGGLGEDELREKFTAKEKTDCEKFVLDMSPGAPFGTCICGRLKKDHTAAALGETVPTLTTRGKVCGPLRPSSPAPPPSSHPFTSTRSNRRDGRPMSGRWTPAMCARR